MCAKIQAMQNIILRTEEDSEDFMLDTDLHTTGGDVLVSSHNVTPIYELHPEPAHAFRLWQLYLDRVNPLLKLIHVPTTQPYVVEWAAKSKDMPKDIEALLFAVYALAATSLSGDECEQILNTKREIAIKNFVSGLQQAIYSAGFLVNYKLSSLQALIMYMVRNPFIIGRNLFINSLGARCYYRSNTTITLRGLLVA
jgi:hypothetical protein